MLYIVPSYHCMLFLGNLMNQIWETSKNLSFGLNFGLFWPKFCPQKFFFSGLPLLDIIHSCKLYAISGKSNKQNLTKWKKPSFRPKFYPNFCSKKFLFQGFYLYLTLYIVGSYHCMLFPGKLINQTWENAKKLCFRTNSGLFWTKFVPQNFFLGFYKY